VIVGGGPTGLMLAGELALAGVDVAIVERRASQALAGSRAADTHANLIGYSLSEIYKLICYSLSTISYKIVYSLLK
jgi:glycine/D-amino acid oxidase-like deaminating enzyme